MARQMDMSPPLDLYFMFTCTDVWEYVLQGRQEYGSCSCATDVCLAQLVCVRFCSRLWWPWSITQNMRETVASERSLDVPSVCVRFTLQGWIRFRIVRFSLMVGALVLALTDSCASGLSDWCALVVPNRGVSTVLAYWSRVVYFGLCSWLIGVLVS
jgi:hypothetical protein